MNKGYADRLVKDEGAAGVRQKTGAGVSAENLDAAAVTTGDQQEFSVRGDVEVPRMNTGVLIVGISQSSIGIDFEYRDSVIL